MYLGDFIFYIDLEKWFIVEKIVENTLDKIKLSLNNICKVYEWGDSYFARLWLECPCWQCLKFKNQNYKHCQIEWETELDPFPLKIIPKIVINKIKQYVLEIKQKCENKNIILKMLETVCAN